MWSRTAGKRLIATYWDRMWPWSGVQKIVLNMNDVVEVVCGGIGCLILKAPS